MCGPPLPECPCVSLYAPHRAEEACFTHISSRTHDMWDAYGRKGLPISNLKLLLSRSKKTMEVLRTHIYTLSKGKCNLLWKEKITRVLFSIFFNISRLIKREFYSNDIIA